MECYLLVSKNQNRAMGLWSKTVSRIEQPRSYRPRETTWASIRPPERSRKDSVAFTSAFDKLRCKHAGGLRSSDFLIPSVSRICSGIPCCCLLKFAHARLIKLSGFEPSKYCWSVKYISEYSLSTSLSSSGVFVLDNVKRDFARITLNAQALENAENNTRTEKIIRRRPWLCEATSEEYLTCFNLDLSFKHK